MASIGLRHKKTTCALSFIETIKEYFIEICLFIWESKACNLRSLTRIPHSFLAHRIYVPFFFTTNTHLSKQISTFICIHSSFSSEDSLRTKVSANLASGFRSRSSVKKSYEASGCSCTVGRRLTHCKQFRVVTDTHPATLISVDSSKVTVHPLENGLIQNTDCTYVWFHFF
jgi:hypothetical protein